jgi:hypothetical protein
VPALARHQLGYVKHTFLRTESYTAANPHLVTTRPASVSRRHWVVGWSRPSTECDPNAASLSRPTTRTPPAP